MIPYPSPNFDDRPIDQEIKYLILHYTGMATGKEALERLCDVQAKVSAHYLIEEDGEIFSLVPEDKRAWHAGVSAWEGNRDINGLSIGIELVNPGHDSPNYKGNYRPFPEAQMRNLITLCQDILLRHDIKPWHVLGHSDVAPLRKCDPGELFDWKKLAHAGIGLWPTFERKNIQEDNIDTAVFYKKLAQFGYDVERDSHAAVIAFQRHFRPKDISGALDKECFMRLESLLQAKKAIQ
ncbi:MAG: N-acetylmuramoyl-L-alanine amidase [Emcibacter sp.]|nr:N-acetylmuramoyl-L-alanine amidase [Emcibacter sp.]